MNPEYDIFDANAIQRDHAEILGDSESEEGNPLIDLDDHDEEVDEEGLLDRLQDDVFNEQLDAARGQVCVIHAIQLCVNAASAAVLAPLIRKTDRLVAATRKSTKRQQKLFHLQRLQPVRGPAPGRHQYALLGRNATRWWSLLVCWERLLLLLTHVRAIHRLDMFANAGVPIEVPTAGEERLMLNVVQLLAPVKRIVTLLDEQSYFTLPHVPGIVHELLSMTSVGNIYEDSVIFAEFRTKFHDELKVRLFKYLSDVTEPAIIAAVLCPTWGVHGLLRLGVAVDDINKIITISIPKWLERSDCIDMAQDDLRAVPQQFARFLQMKTPELRAADYYAEVSQLLYMQPEVPGVQFSKEFLLESTAATKKWYDDLGARHAPLKKLARMIFSISPSTGSAEQYVSGAGLIDAERRGRLGPTTLEQVVVAHAYLIRLSNQSEFNFDEFAGEVYNYIKDAVGLDELDEER
jgi:hypothetical protein